MNSQNQIFVVLQMLVPQSLTLLVYLAGLVLALTRWQRHPRASLLTLLATGLGCVSIVAVSAVHILLPRLMHANMEAMRVLYVAISLASAVVHATVISLLLAAIFARREPPARPVLGSEPPVLSS